MKDDIDFDPQGYLLFDGTVVAKPYAKAIEPVCRQCRGSEKRVVEGIGVTTCVSVNPKTHGYWIIDYRIYDLKDDDIAVYRNRVHVRDEMGECKAALNNRGLVKTDLNQHVAAVTDYNMAIQLKPDYAHAYFNRGVLLSEIRATP